MNTCFDVANYFLKCQDEDAGDVMSNLIPGDIDTLELFDTKTHDVLSMVYDYYGQFSAWKLRNLTHNDPPWIVAHRKGNVEITHEDMKSYFKTRLVDDEG